MLFVAALVFVCIEIKIPKIDFYSDYIYLLVTILYHNIYTRCFNSIKCSSNDCFFPFFDGKWNTYCATYNKIQVNMMSASLSTQISTNRSANRILGKHRNISLTNLILFECKIDSAKWVVHHSVCSEVYHVSHPRWLKNESLYMYLFYLFHSFYLYNFCILSINFKGQLLW